ncbi:hypothetical protein E2C01_092242 [Portunus trituberculatus]|uniref:Uncharacterized protein n=1 Tax=Portunus trituberculatus TaxID=210409 RepID=A0A5B7JQ25_PORTR|nr:hypothetical protein [Portunus trituberculatus]
MPPQSSPCGGAVFPVTNPGVK